MFLAKRPADFRYQVVIGIFRLALYHHPVAPEQHRSFLSGAILPFLPQSTCRAFGDLQTNNNTPMAIQ